ncbi:hypothetical protein OXPF_40040 [Oxobacter pfennigii]|uniref:DUF4364 domain-containing protein n=1 Tax=Oxobacter pfennigii TaxID=36849 RepID=A0A0P8WJB1_9CLOT|nr:DUF4364 family protein [Oxobacter pfennigii]KPU42220.1 hypothetical protein OXPF_40040 [Oxobacter pfennigii]
MFGDTYELAESKLLLLYIFKTIKQTVSNSSITEIVLENGFMNYFHLQQYLSELASSELLNVYKDGKRVLYELSSKGKNTLEYFENRIADSKKESVDLYLSKHNEQLKNDIKFTAGYAKHDDDSYLVTLNMIDNTASDIFELKISIKSIEEAKKVCSNWNSSAKKNRKKILDILLSK